MIDFIHRLHPWLVSVISLLTWIILLSFGLSLLFGAGFSGGWIIAGALFSIAAFGGLLLTKELTDAILSPEFSQFAEKISFKRRSPSISKNKSAIIRADRRSVDPRRVMLGLCMSEFSVNNRRRSGKYRAA
jgi:divalent metal cation (Fe/Co/Zn/Cd) transporter